MFSLKVLQCLRPLSSAGDRMVYRPLTCIVVAWKPRLYADRFAVIIKLLYYYE